MTSGRFLLLMALIIAVIPMPQIASADNIVVDIAGSPPQNPGSDPACQQPNCVNLAGDYGATCPGTTVKAITITNNLTGTARVEVMSDPGTNGIDYLATKNLKITANCAVTNLRIAFGFNHVSQPATPPDLRYTYKASGSFSASNGRSIKVKTSYRNTPPSPPSTAYNTAIGGEKSYNTNLLTFNLSDTSATNISSITDPRGLEGEFTFTLPTQNDLLRITTYYIQNTTSSGGGGGGNGGLLSTLCPTTESTAKAFGCESCVSEDGTMAEDAKAQVFAHATWDNLSQDLATGQGEYLTSLAVLLKVPNDQQSVFFSLAENHYLELTQTGATTPDDFVATLKERMPAYLSVVSAQVTRQ